MKEKIKKSMKAGGLLSAIIIGIVVGTVLLANVTFVEQRVWVKDIQLPAVGDYDPGSGKSGWLNMTVCYNASNAATYYARNLTNNASMYAWTNVNDTHAGNNTPYGTALALWYNVRINTTDGYCTANTTWMPSWVHCNVTSAGLSLNDVGMDRYVISSGGNASFMWLAFVCQSGLSISMGQNVTSCTFAVDIYK